MHDDRKADSRGEWEETCPETEPLSKPFWLQIS